MEEGFPRPRELVLDGLINRPHWGFVIFAVPGEKSLLPEPDDVDRVPYLRYYTILRNIILFTRTPYKEEHRFCGPLAAMSRVDFFFVKKLFR